MSDGRDRDEDAAAGDAEAPGTPPTSPSVQSLGSPKVLSTEREEEALDDTIERTPYSFVGTMPPVLEGYYDEQGRRLPLTEEQLRRLDVIVYSFGSPRVGNHGFAESFDALVPHAFRVVFDGDLIASIPKFLCAYKHTGTEVVLDEYGNIIVDPSFLERSFRARRRTSLRAHSMNSYRRGLLRARALDEIPPAPELEEIRRRLHERSSRA